MRLSELTNEMLSTYKYPNLMAEVKESTYSICTIAEHIGLGRYRKEDDSKVWSRERHGYIICRRTSKDRE